MTDTKKKKSGLFKKLFIFLLLGVIYLVSSVPIGLFLYSLKSEAGINVFSNTGFHSYMSCLKEQVEIATQE